MLGALLLFLVENASLGASLDEGSLPLLAPLASVFCCLGLFFWLGACLGLIGLASAVRAAAQGEPVHFTVLFEPRERFLTMVLARLGKWLAWVVCSLPFGVLVGGPIVIGSALDQAGLGTVLGILGGIAYLPLWGYLVLGLTLVEEVVAFEGRARSPPSAAPSSSCGAIASRSSSTRS